MLGDFRYKRVPGGQDVVVDMYWAGEERMAQLIVPEAMAEKMSRKDMPTPGDLPVISAVGYGLYLAANSNTRLLLSGDRSVWPQEWGQLIEVH